MRNTALKLELIEWLTQLDNAETLQYLRMVRDADMSGKDWWDDLSVQQKTAIQKGLEDVKQGKVVPHEDVKRKNGL